MVDQFAEKREYPIQTQKDDDDDVYQDCEEDEFEHQMEELKYIGISPVYQRKEIDNHYINTRVFSPKLKHQNLSIQGNKHLQGNNSSSAQHKNGLGVFILQKLYVRI